MGWLAAIGAIATLLTTILVWIQKGTAKSTEQKVEEAKAAVLAEDAEAQKTGRPGK